jgi:hypothetical protein
VVYQKNKLTLYKNLEIQSIMQITINVEDSRYWQFLQFIKTLDYVKIQENLTTTTANEEQPKPQKISLLVCNPISQ